MQGSNAKLDTYAVGDTITIKLDLNEQTLQIGKNGGLLRQAFTAIPKNQTYHAFVNFNDQRGNRQDIIQIIHDNK